MKASDKKKLQRAIAYIDKAYDCISDVIGSLEKQGSDKGVLELEDVQREISNQQYYINEVIIAEQ
ncbi:MAG: hypothetical protein IIT64_03665 [Bacteroidaceae bacterium]|nr:hypothetical protein [Bacteroidaceae bacterium]